LYRTKFYPTTRPTLQSRIASPLFIPSHSWRQAGYHRVTPSRLGIDSDEMDIRTVNCAAWISTREKSCSVDRQTKQWNEIHMLRRWRHVTICL